LSCLLFSLKSQIEHRHCDSTQEQIPQLPRQPRWPHRQYRRLIGRRRTPCRLPLGCHQGIRLRGGRAEGGLMGTSKGF
jgi:hypothetical protein